DYYCCSYAGSYIFG
nr:immunoglobulin light chain junction region [Macaca mulatta]MOX74561.1 immunoglobulin light chain junction region [Macaca mulatta]